MYNVFTFGVFVSLRDVPLVTTETIAHLSPAAACPVSATVTPRSVKIRLGGAW